MAIEQLAISGYRSLRSVALGLDGLNVVTGANGSGKSSLYRALKLLADIAQGRIIQSLAREGGLQSTLWAGPEGFSRAMRSGDQPVQGTRRKNPISLRLGFTDQNFGYAIDLGLPQHAWFPNDPEIKVEALWNGSLSRSSVFAERRGPLVRVRGETGEWRNVITSLAQFDSMMPHCADPKEAPELLSLRERMRSWRFYDQLRSDRDAPARKPQIGTYTPVLADDGANLAAAIVTITRIGDADGFADAVADAFPGASVEIHDFDGYVEVRMVQHGLLRPLHVSELSDGTLRYLCLIAALLSPRPPELMVLNEPESSLHPDLMAPLARLIARAAKHSQIIVVSHASALVGALEAEAGCKSILLDKELGETVVRGGSEPKWTWPAR